MNILGIETSCDETAFAVVKQARGRFFVEKNLVASQVDLHTKYGGVVPEVAARCHAEALIPLLLEARIQVMGKGIDAIAVTAGPGLVPALRLGVELAKTLAWVWKKPLVAVNHLEGHIYSVWMKDVTELRKVRNYGSTEQADPKFPALVLLVSGGHTELILMRDHGQYELLGATRDDAAGEAFDKVAKLLGLGYPGGPIISKLAKDGRVDAINFPRPMLESGDFDFSFSGLKTAVAVYLKQRPPLTPPYPPKADPPPADKGGETPRVLPLHKGEIEGVSVQDICASFQEAVVETLVAKTKQAALKYRPASIILSGGVSANARLRESLCSAFAIPVYVPYLKYTTDNAAMIAVAGYFRAQKKDFADPLTLVADPNLSLCHCFSLRHCRREKQSSHFVKIVSLPLVARNDMFV